MRAQAYFAPFTYERHCALVAELQCHEEVTLEMLVSVGSAGRVGVGAEVVVVVVFVARTGGWCGGVATRRARTRKHPPAHPHSTSPHSPLQGETLDGHDLDLLRIGTPAEGKKNVWVVARQHPGA